MKKIILLSFIVFAAIVCCAAFYVINSKSSLSYADYTTPVNFDNKDINEYIEIFKNDKNALLLDVRNRDEIKAGKIPGSKNIPLNELGTAEFDYSKTIYIYCKSGQRSEQAARLLKAKGYNTISIGGILDYKGNLE